MLERSFPQLVAMVMMAGCTGSAATRATSLEEERCATFTDTFSIALADGRRYVEHHNDVCGSRSCEVESEGHHTAVECLPAPAPQLAINARRLRDEWFEVRASSEGLAGFAVVTWSPAARRIVLERDLGLAGQVEALDVDGRIALTANCNLALPECPLIDGPSRSWWLDASGALSPRTSP